MNYKRRKYLSKTFFFFFVVECARMNFVWILEWRSKELESVRPNSRFIGNYAFFTLLFVSISVFMRFLKTQTSPDGNP